MYFSRILTTKCELIFDCKERLVFYRYSTLSARHLNMPFKLALSFSKEVTSKFYKINISPSHEKREKIKRAYLAFE